MKIGILGGGQLARMLALAGYPLGLDFVIIDPSSDAGAIGLSNHLHGAYNDESLLQELAQQASRSMASRTTKHIDCYLNPRYDDCY